MKERTCSSWSKLYRLRVDSALEGLYCTGKQRGSHKNCNRGGGVSTHDRENLLFI